jgi:hypothetical protein
VRSLSYRCSSQLRYVVVTMTTYVLAEWDRVRSAASLLSSYHRIRAPGGRSCRPDLGSGPREVLNHPLKGCFSLFWAPMGLCGASWGPPHSCAFPGHPQSAQRGKYGPFWGSLTACARMLPLWAGWSQGAHPLRTPKSPLGTPKSVILEVSQSALLAPLSTGKR